MLVNKRRTAILDIGHPFCITEVGTNVELAQLVIQISKCNINVDHKKIQFFVVVVDCS
ncbi:hypothetical protein A2U01_0093120 [Trifolium medium]|uniref:Uncharacterized protein n=1 Tax=Trifolium medium TaxID=97028 RepID=A0A392UGN1_9FABA|nr:hypothetical protein [Trifolium medium]